MGERRDAYRVVVGKSEGKRSLGRPMHRREYNIKMYLQEVWWVGMDWIELAQYTDGRRDVVNEVMKLLVAQSAWGEG